MAPESCDWLPQKTGDSDGRHFIETSLALKSRVDYLLFSKRTPGMTRLNLPSNISSVPTLPHRTDEFYELYAVRKPIWSPSVGFRVLRGGQRKVASEAL